MGTPNEILTAVYQKNLSVLQRASSSELNAADGDGRIPLIHAVLAEHAEPEIVRLLIERGSDINKADLGQQWTALHFAARERKAEIVHLLLEAGAKVDAMDVFGNTPLWRAVSQASPSLPVVQDLLAHGADPFKKNKTGVSPADIARSMGRTDLLALFEGKE
jgi:ankyrin repeat protein